MKAGRGIERTARTFAKAQNYVSIIGTDEAMPAKPLFVLAESRVPPFDLAVSRPRYNGRVAASTKKPK